MRHALIIAFVISGVVAAAPRSTQAPPDATDLARRLQTNYDKIHSFTAQFTQTYASGGLALKVAPEKGEIRVKKPDRFRMETTAPVRKTTGSDGRTLYFYDHQARTASEEPLPKGGDAPTALMFIAGRGNLLRDFTPSVAPTQPDGVWHLDLAPRTANSDFKQLTLIVDRTSLMLRGFSWTDHQGGTNTVRLERLRENPTLADRDFSFQIPAGVQRIKR
jgi:outer membrane lipoprotein carrier protein